MAKLTKAPGPAEHQAPAAAPVPEAAIDWSTYAGMSGFETTKPEDFGVPLLDIVQKGSPEFDTTHKDYATKKIEGCKPGDIFNSVSRKVLASMGKESLAVICCGYEKTFVEWKSQSIGGGLVKVHRDERILNEVTGRDENNRDILRNGNQLATTQSFYVLILQKGEKPTPAIINMTSTQLKHGRFWLNMMSGIRIGPNRICPPMFSHIYLLNTAIESNMKGSWLGWTIQIGDMVTDRDLAIQAGEITKKVALSVQQAQKLIGAPPKATDDDVPM